MRQIVLAFDVVNQKLASFQGSAATLPPFRQASYQLRVYLVQPVADSVPGEEQYEIFDSTSFDGLRIGFWSSTTGTLGDSPSFVLALTPQTDLIYVADTYSYYQGEISLYTQQIAAAMGSNSTLSAYLAVNLVDGATLYPVYDHEGGSTNVVINSATDEGGGLPIDVHATVPNVDLPVHFTDAASGEVYALTRTAAGVLEFVWLNPP